MKPDDLESRKVETEYGDDRKTPEDNVQKLSLKDTRKPKLTLLALNKLRKIRALKKLEWNDRKELLKVMYGSTPEPQM